MNILFLRGFNNYFNRVVKKYSTLADYKANCSSFVEFSNINFNPNDGVVTELVIGNESQKENQKILDWENIGTPDYCICWETISNNTTIRSRWFVLESERTRSGQYRLALKRDVVAEHFGIIKASPCFIEKGMINDKTNTLLYNKESMTYNQIKDAEYQLKDSTNSAWVVGYVSKNLPTADRTISTTILMEGTPQDYYESAELPFNVGLSTHYAYDASQMEIELLQLGSYEDDDFSGSRYGAKQYMHSYVITSDASPSIYHTQELYADSNGSVGSGRATNISQVPDKLYIGGYWYAIQTSPSTKINMQRLGLYCTSSNQQPPAIYGWVYGGINPSYLKRTSNNINTAVQLLRGHAASACNTAFSSYGNVVSNLEQYDGKVVKFNNKYYSMSISKVSYRTGVFKVDNYNDWILSSSNNKINGLTQYYSDISNSTDLSNLRSDIQNLYNTAYNTSDSTYGNTYASNHSFDACGISIPRYSITLTLISTETLSVSDVAYGTRNTTYDCPADLFAIPYGEVAFKTTSDSSTYYTSKTEALAIARAIATAYGDSGCYDLQLVPYCPSEFIRSLDDDTIGIYELDSKAYKVVTKIYSSGDTPEPCSFIIWASSCKGSFDIPLVIENYHYDYSDVLNAKINNETTLCRLASPNFNGMFEFSLSKNNGITKFNVDYTYKPYMPYIHVNPDFKFIYGQDWDDARGLICGGDFSLSFMNSYWQNYQNNNKNYQSIFDRQIQNMDVNNAIALEKQQFQATVGTITSAIGGAMGGAAAGATAGSAAGPWGALIGGVVGAVGGGIGSGMASAYGAEKDKDWLLRQQQEARSYAIDMYGYQLGNIQAMPYSLSRTESLTNNNKIWPILELYKPTDIEIQLLVNKIRYNGMSVMAVGNIKDYCTSDDFTMVFIKGQIIRLESDELNDDFHIADAIYQEINKGVYIQSGGL